jgi:cysteine-rich repeat protein
MTRSRRYLSLYLLLGGLVCLYGCPTCGDGKVESPEQCDDGNTVGTDGCSASCKIETGYACAGSPSTCVAGVGAGTNCVTGTAADFSAAIAKYPDAWNPVKTKAQQLGFNTTTFDNVMVCDEGTGPSQWIAHIPAAAGQPKDNYGAGVFLRPDIPSAQVVLYYETGRSKEDSWMVTPFLIFHQHLTDPMEITNINGDALPAPQASAAKGLVDRFFRRSR